MCKILQTRKYKPMQAQTKKTQSAQQDDVVIKIENVWKIFGDNADSAMQAILDRRLSKQQILEEYNKKVLGAKNL